MGSLVLLVLLLSINRFIIVWHRVLAMSGLLLPLSNFSFLVHVFSFLMHVFWCKLQPVILRAALLTIYKSFRRPHLDYGDVIYCRAFKESFQKKLETVQYNPALAITGAIRGSSREKLDQELCFESLKSRRWYRKPCLFFKLKKINIPLTFLI